MNTNSMADSASNFEVDISLNVIKSYEGLVMYNNGNQTSQIPALGIDKILLGASSNEP